MKYFLILTLISFNSIAQLFPGRWHAALKLNDTLELPFTFTTDSNKLIIQNGDENIIADEIKYKGDSVFIRMPVFDSEFRCRFDDKNLTGNFINHARKNFNVIPFHAERGLSYRFSDRPEKSKINISGRYRVEFDGEDDESKVAVGIFKQEGGRVTGTFLTATGDYRFLEGEVNGDRLWLSAFDGSHLFLFTAMVKKDTLYNGEFFSGRHWHDTWRGFSDANVKLPDAESLTEAKSINEKFGFSFRDLNGKIVSLKDKKYKNKAVIIQIMGSWCPNCMDETKFLSHWYNFDRNKNIEVIALDYERITDSISVAKNIKRLKRQFNIRYPILFAGPSDKKEAAKTLPLLSRIFAFPTLIFLDKNKNVVKIHTGFSGPATGTAYENFKNWFVNVTDSLYK